MKKDYAILRLKLIEIIPAYELSRLTSTINDIYDIFLEIENTSVYKRLSHIFIPGEEEKLYIKKASIGTPNSIEFFGVREHLLNAVYFLGTNFNDNLSIKKARVLEHKKSASIRDYLIGIQEDSDTIQSGEMEWDIKQQMGRLKSLEDELTKLKNAALWDDTNNKEKLDYIHYVKNISSLSQNIITDADLLIIKPTSEP